MSLLGSIFNVAHKGFQARIAHAHCDIPCGIYDPHLAQLAALTVVRMNQLIQGLDVPGPDSSPEAQKAYGHALSRYTEVKEEHAELCKRELRILWGDYFKPEHVQENPNLHDLFFNALKSASKARQNQDLEAAQQLLSDTQDIAAVFWKTKGAEISRQPSRQGAAGGELIYPA